MDVTDQDLKDLATKKNRKITYKTQRVKGMSTRKQNPLITSLEIGLQKAQEEQRIKEQHGPVKVLVQRW